MRLVLVRLLSCRLILSLVSVVERCCRASIILRFVVPSVWYSVLLRKLFLFAISIPTACDLCLTLRAVEDCTVGREDV